MLARSKFMPVVRVAAPGNALEMYDFPATFFPSGSEFASLMFSFSHFRRRLSDAASRRHRSRRLHRSSRTARRAAPHAGAHGLRHSRHRVPARLRHSWTRRAIAGSSRPPGAGLLRGRRTRRSLGLPFRNRSTKVERLLRQLAIRQPASRGHVRRAARYRPHLHVVRRPNVALGMADRTLGRMLASPAAALPAPIAPRDRRVSRAAAPFHRIRNRQDVGRELAPGAARHDACPP